MGKGLVGDSRNGRDRHFLFRELSEESVTDSWTIDQQCREFDGAVKHLRHAEYQALQVTSLPFVICGHPAVQAAQGVDE